MRAVLWDNDGVLVDTEGLFFEANRRIFAQRGIAVSQADFADWSLRRGKSLFDMLEDATQSERDALRSERNLLYAELIASGVRVFDGVESCLGSLYGKLPMAIVTSAYPNHFETIHSQLSLLRYFEFALTSADYTHHKPHPEPYLMAARRLGIAPSDCLVIEDSERGLQAANRAGMRCVVVPNELAPEGDFATAFARLENLRELPRLVATLVS